MITKSLIAVAVVLGLIVLVLFVLTKFFFMDLFGTGWKSAHKNFPVVAKRLDLSFEAAGGGFLIGEMSGTYRGYDISVRPDLSALVKLEIGRSLDMVLDSVSGSDSGINAGFQEVEFDSAKLNHFFKIRMAKVPLAERLEKSERLSRFIVEFGNRWGREVRRLKVDGQYIYCYFPHGRERYIPTKYIELILNDMVDLADILKSL